MTDKIRDRLTGAFWGALVCFLVSYMAGGYHFRDTAKTVVRTDTLHDTVTVREPVFVTERAVRTDTVWLPVIRTRTDTVFLRSNGPKDSAWAVVPITQKVYADSTYKAWVSGYNPRLDSIQVYRQTIVTTKTETVVRKRRIGIGVQAGYGYGFQYRGLEPYVGLGVSWNF
ncbi:DUF6808 domain-containing protein [Segatella buccae]|uniref:DUF6808 domain-containing protein n=1 Tax=Segatella buccae TaxID=28126 RepID=UPI0022E7C32B|nr:hypothetical protein [Segatella buccae]